MCFSATASFTASGALIPMGAYAVAKTISKRQRRFIPLALAPVAFGLQQFAEGMVWLGIEHSNMPSARSWSLVFLFFSHFFWPFFVPFMSYSAEVQSKRRRYLGLLTIAGFILGAACYIPFLINADWFDPVVVNCHIDYSTIALLDIPSSRLLYVGVVLIPLFVSSHRVLKFFGLGVLISLTGTFFVWNYAFVSVWCFFAAILSAYMIYEVRRLPKG